MYDVVASGGEVSYCNQLNTSRLALPLQLILVFCVFLYVFCYQRMLSGQNVTPLSREIVGVKDLQYV